MKKEDKYTGVVKAINENTGIAMRVLPMTAILVMLCLFSVQSVSAVQVTENVKFQTPGTNTTFIMGSNFTFDTIEVHSTELRLNDAVISVCPSAGSIDFTLFSFSTEYRKWTESCSNPNAIADHTMSGLKPNTPYDVKVNGAIYGQYRSDESGYVFFTYSGGYSDIMFEMEEAGAPPKFIAHFMTPEGEPYPFDVTISDGTWREEWHDVTYIETEVPETATYTCNYKTPTKSASIPIEISFSAGEVRSFTFYAIDWEYAEPRTRPYIYMEEEGANATLTWEYDNVTNVLTWNLSGEPGKIIGLSTMIKNPGGDPNWGQSLCACNPHWCEKHCVHNDLDIPRSAVEVCEDSCIHNNFLGPCKSEINGFVEFVPIPNDLGLLRIWNIQYNDKMFPVPYETELRDLNGTLIPQNLVDPQYAVPEGNYLLEIQGLPTEYWVPKLPVKVVAGMNWEYRFTALQINALKVTELEPWDFSIVAEYSNFISQCSYSNLVHDEKNKRITVDVSTESDYYDWWGCFVLLDTVTVAAVRSRMPGAWHDLDELYDYTINPVDGYKIVVVRISPETEQVILVYKVVEPDLVITEKWLCWPDNCTICYNVTNTGDGTAPAGHNTALYVDGVAVAHDRVPVDLAPGESYTGCFDGYTWTYTPPSDNITVCADKNETLDELDEDNNCLTNIWMCGDVNGDEKVTMSDVRKVFNRYLDPNYPLDSPWAADVNCDGKVTMSDVRKVFNRYFDPGYELNCCCEEVG